jgi:hypothetical protein
VSYRYDRRASYDRRAAKTLELSHYGLEGMTEGRPVTLYHGTTRTFTSFDLGKSRTELVNKFYGSGIFLVPSKRVAVEYAGANRNTGLEPDIIGHLKSRNSKAGAFLESLYKHGDEKGWADLIQAVGVANPGEQYPANLVDEYLGVDANTVGDIAAYIEGTKVKKLGGGGDSFVNIFDTSTGAPSWLYDELDQVGLDSSVYRPKVYTCDVHVKNPLITASKSEAKSARQKGYDSVIFHGSDLVGGVPEVAVYDPSNVKIKHVEIV